MLDDPLPPGTVGEIEDLLSRLQNLVAEARSMPLSGNVLMDREVVESLLERLRAELPDEIKAARWMVREREAFIARTNEQAQEMINRAKTESKRLISESYVLAEAVEEANILVRRAEGEARRIRLEAEDEIESALERLEGMLAELLTRVHKAREELHQARPKTPESPH